jgi:hypothetical protein
VRRKRAGKVPGRVVTCPHYHLGLRGCGRKFTPERYYAEGRLVLCPGCGLFFPKDLPDSTSGSTLPTTLEEGSFDSNSALPVSSPASGQGGIA